MASIPKTYAVNYRWLKLTFMCNLYFFYSASILMGSNVKDD